MATMGVDIGTTGTKAIVLLPGGRLAGSAYREYPLHHPRPGWAELDPRHVWQIVSRVIHEAAASCRERIKAIAFSALGEAVTPVGKDGEPLDNTLIAMDNRAEAECRWIGEKLGAREMFQLTGQPLHPMYSLNKILWWRNQKPEVYRRAWKFLCWQDYAAYRLCGMPVIDYSLASRMFTFDIRTLRWSPKILEAVEIDETRLPMLQASGTVIAPVRPEVADALGLHRDTQVVAGGFDQPSAALGAGIFSPGLAVDGLGTVECITPVLDHPVTEDTLLENNIPCCPHVVEGMYIFMGFNFTGGNLLRWYRDQFAHEEKIAAQQSGREVYDLIVENAMKVKTGAMVLPHFLGTGTPHLDPHSRGAILGLTLGTTRHHIARAIIEGITYEMRLNLQILEQAGVTIHQLRATGGGAKSEAWLQLKADIFNKSITAMKTTEGGCLAMAMQAAIACGEYATIEEALQDTVHLGKEFRPNPAHSMEYNQRFDTYLQIYPKLLEINHQLAQIDDACHAD